MGLKVGCFAGFYHHRVSATSLHIMHINILRWKAEQKHVCEQLLCVKNIEPHTKQ